MEDSGGQTCPIHALGRDLEHEPLQRTMAEIHLLGNLLIHCKGGFQPLSNRDNCVVSLLIIGNYLTVSLYLGLQAVS